MGVWVQGMLHCTCAAVLCAVLLLSFSSAVLIRHNAGVGGWIRWTVCAFIGHRAQPVGCAALVASQPLIVA